MIDSTETEEGREEIYFYRTNIYRYISNAPHTKKDLIFELEVHTIHFRKYWTKFQLQMALKIWSEERF